MRHKTVLMNEHYKQMWGQLTEDPTINLKNEPGKFREISTRFYNKICAPERVVYAKDVMLYYLQHIKKPCKMSPRDFSLRWSKMLHHKALLKKHYDKEPNKVKTKLMYIRAFPKAYHQNFITNGKNFDQMSKEDIT